MTASKRKRPLNQLPPKVNSPRRRSSRKTIPKAKKRATNTSSSNRVPYIAAGILGMLLVSGIGGFVLYDLGIMGSKPELIISKEATYITEPLDDEGYPDYIAYVNQQIGPAPPPEENVIAGIFEACGDLSAFDNEYDEYAPVLAKAFGVSVPKHEVLAAVDTKYENGNLEGPHGSPREIFTYPWKRADYPAVATWVDAHENFFTDLGKALDRKKMWSPAYRADITTCLLEIDVRFYSKYRGIARRLNYAAMMSLGGGDFQSAFEYIRMLYRLGNVCAQCGITGFAKQGIAISCLTEAVVCELRMLTIPGCPSDLARDSNATDYARSFQYTSNTGSIEAGRIGLLDLICMWDRSPQTARSKYERWGKLVDKHWPSAIDINRALKLVNSDADLSIRFLQATGPQMKSIQRSLNSVIESRTKLSEKITSAVSVTGASDDELARAMENFKKLSSEERAIGLCYIICHDYGQIPPLSKNLYRREQFIDLQLARRDLAYALAFYRFDHEAYPADLHELVPKYLDKVPLDPASDQNQPFSYFVSPDRQAYVAVSVGLTDRKLSEKADYTSGYAPRTDTFDDVIIGHYEPYAPNESR